MSEFPAERRCLMALAAAWAVNTFAYSIVYPFLPIYLHSIRGLPMATVGLVFPIMGGAALLGEPVAGWLSDRLGRRPLLVGGPLLRSAIFVILAAMAAQAAPFWSFAVVLFLAAMAGSFFQNASDSYITELVPVERRAAAFSRVRVGLNIGWMAGPAVGAFLAQTPFALLFALTAGFCLVTAGIAWQLLPPLPRRHAADRPGQPPPWRLLAGLPENQHLVLTVLALVLILHLSVSQFVSTLSVFGTEHIGISRSQLGFLYTINGAMVILFLLPLNRIAGEGRLCRRIALGAAIYVVSFIAIGLSRRWLHLAGAMVLLTVGEMCALPAIVALVSRLTHPERIGRLMGLHGLALGIGRSLGPWLGALAYASLIAHPVLLWGLLASGAGGAALGFAILARRRTLDLATASDSA